MLDKTKTKTRLLVVHGSDAAPVIYTDGPVAFGFINGVLQLELAVQTLVPTLDGDKQVLKSRTVAVAHLRLSLTAAQELQHTLEQALVIATAPEKKN